METIMVAIVNNAWNQPYERCVDVPNERISLIASIALK